MELLIKLYNDRPSRIGVTYAMEYQAVRPYEQLVNSYPGHTFHITAEILENKMNLTLTSDQSGAKVFYGELDFKMEQLVRMQALMNQGLPVEFVHVYPDKHTLVIAKPFRKQQFFSVSGVELLNPENFVV